MHAKYFYWKSSAPSSGSSPEWDNQYWHVDAIPVGEELVFEVWHSAVLGEDKLLQTGTFAIPSELSGMLLFSFVLFTTRLPFFAHLDKKEFEVGLTKPGESAPNGALHILVRHSKYNFYLSKKY